MEIQERSLSFGVINPFILIVSEKISRVNVPEFSITSVVEIIGDVIKDSVIVTTDDVVQELETLTITPNREVVTIIVSLQSQV